MAKTAKTKRNQTVDTGAGLFDHKGTGEDFMGVGVGGGGGGGGAEAGRKQRGSATISPSVGGAGRMKKELERKEKEAAAVKLKKKDVFDFSDEDEDEEPWFEPWGAKDHEPWSLPEYLKYPDGTRRNVLDKPLEEVMKTSPFESYTLFKGQKVKKGLFGQALKGDYRPCGIFKAVIRVIYDEDDVFKPPGYEGEWLQDLKTPVPVRVRFYMMKGFDFQPRDPNGGKSDPFLTLNLGKHKVSDRKNYKDDQTDPEIFKCFELATKLPGASQLVVKAWDWDMLSTDDLIGQTTIDLEDRWFDQRWKKFGEYGRKGRRYRLLPTERRPLYCPLSEMKQGDLECWVEILNSEETSTYEKTDISLPPAQEFEFRVIVWKTVDVKPDDEWEGMNDMYLVGWVEGSEANKQHTDTHWRCANGKGSFNWRYKFPVLLPMKEDFSRLHVQIWDKDVFSSNDCIAQKDFDVQRLFKKAYKKDEVVQAFDDIKTKKRANKSEEDVRKEKQKREEKAKAAANSAPAKGADADDNGDGGGETKNEVSVTAEVEGTGDESETTGLVGGAAPMGGESKTGGGGGGPADKEKGKKEKPDSTKEFIDSIKGFAGIIDTPPNSKRLTFTMNVDELDKKGKKTGKRVKEERGEVFLSMELLPRKAALAKPAGFGRSEPNANPHLPPPVGRIKWLKMFNPFYFIVRGKRYSY